jgi:hypothetical protein
LNTVAEDTSSGLVEFMILVTLPSLGPGARMMSSQQFTAGEWVRTESGEVGRVVHTARLTVFVQMEGDPKEATVKAFLESQLTRIESPGDQQEPPTELP